MADANHQISMMKIDLATLKQEKAMKEKSASLQISNLKQKLAGTQRVLEDLKVVAMLFMVALVFRRKSMSPSVGPSTACLLVPRFFDG